MNTAKEKKMLGNHIHCLINCICGIITDPQNVRETSGIYRRIKQSTTYIALRLTYFSKKHLKILVI